VRECENAQMLKL